MTTRINARLAPELAQKLAELQRRTGKGTTALIQAALERYYDAEHGSQHPAELLADFVGCAEGPRGLSTTYKSDLRRLLDKKS
jgi:hypothetical protein